MSMRFVLPVAAMALALGTTSASYAQDASQTQVRPAQAPQMTRCDEMMREVEIEMPSAVGLRVAAARKNAREAQQLCETGHEEDGVEMLRGVLSSVHEGG